MNYTQYKSSDGSYGSFSNEALIDKLPIFGDYTLIRSGRYQYVLVTGETNDGETFSNATVYEVNWNDYSGSYTMSTHSYDDVVLSISNDYYCYGTQVGRLYGGYDRYTIPVLSGVILISLVGFFLFHIIHDIRYVFMRGK